MAKMRISPELKKLIEKYRCVKDTEGMSPAKVYKLVGENENLYLKMTDSRYKGTTYDVEREKDMMLWLEGKLPVPKVLHFERHDGWSNLLMSEADGVLCSEEYEDEQSPEKIIELYAECIRLFHSIDISDCPYTNSLDSRLAELDYLLNNDLADVDCENWEEDTPFKDPRELYDFLKTEKPEEELVFSVRTGNGGFPLIRPRSKERKSNRAASKWRRSRMRRRRRPRSAARRIGMSPPPACRSTPIWSRAG